MHRLRVLAERDPGVLLMVLERFANLNMIPDRFSAVCGPDDDIRIKIDVTGIPPAVRSRSSIGDAYSHFVRIDPHSSLGAIGWMDSLSMHLEYGFLIVKYFG